jgi:diguanylate cyclase (GGDEF)-like protein
MVKRIFVVFFLLCSIPQAFTQEQYVFTALELEMDKIANTSGADTSEILVRMDNLLKNTSDATPDERALFLTYDCALRAGLASSLAEDRFKDLQKLSMQFSANASVRAATGLCEASLANYHKDNASYQQAMFKAFQFAQQAKLATLRYWISLNVYSLFIKYHDYQTSKKALLIGLQVAHDNNDQSRLTTVNQLLAETYLATKKYQLALKHNDAAQQAMNKISGKLYQGELYSNKARILTGLKTIDKAIAFYQQALSLAKQSNSHREVQFIHLDIAYLYILQKKNSAAKSLISNVKLYGIEYNDSLLNNSAVLLQSFVELNENNLIVAKQHFNQSIEYFNTGSFEEIAIDAWKKQVEIANINNHSDIIKEAEKQYFTLLEQAQIKGNQSIQNIVIDSYKQIRLDDAVIANEKLAKAITQREQLAENSKVLLIGVIMLASLLFIIIAKFSWRLKHKYKLKKEEINRQLYYDPLTQCFNRRYFDDIICKNLIDQNIANQTSYLVMVDIDHFKSFNDTYGHSAGDTVLKELVKNLQSDSRLNDNVIRMGGEEFILTLPPNDNLRVEVVIERILHLVSHSPVVIEDKPRNISISIGFVPIEKATNKTDIEDLINLADKALYVAKETGRNRAIGVSKLQCPANYIDKILVANENKLLVLTEVTPRAT